MAPDDNMLAEIAAEHGTPCFVYDLDEVAHRVGQLNTLFSQMFQVSYAMKCNPHGEFLALFRDSIPSLDISSGGELHRALAVGWDARKISFTGPAKQRWELQAAVDASVGKVIVESVAEAIQLNDIALTRGVRQPILARVAPAKIPGGFGVNMSGKPCQFGIDEEDAQSALTEIIQLPHLELVGFHVYSGTQCLNPAALVENFQYVTELFTRLSRHAAIKPQTLIFGSGFGLPYHEGMSTLDIKSVADATVPLLQKLQKQPQMQEAQFLLELGRWLVGEAGIYLTSVVARKESRGKSIALCDGGMNHHLGAAGHLGSIIHRNYQMWKLGDGAQKLGEENSAEYSIVGPLCTSIDTLGHSVRFRDLAVGDTIAISCSGAYGFSASPLNFISHDLPREIFVQTDQAGDRKAVLAEPEFTPGKLAWS